ncbi:adenosylcobinamide-phosphate synthase CbiB [Candidatus Magnetominusculus dajiuhuensis]|uniref:adenosylcobinamide-phosphate synthase CbiB n=1 Tax=Candidatus Magnetominusculus dajiuhuensis TaxID=3137712 RepID=UPI003B438B0E
MFLLSGIPVQLLTAFAVDICVGDPVWFPHPVRYMGGLIGFLDRRLRKPARTPLYNLTAGAVAAAITVGLTYGAAYLFAEVFLSPLRQYMLFNTISLYDVTTGVTGSLALAYNGLIKSVLLVRDKLQGADDEGARAALSLIVGRDTKPLTREGIARAAIETAAENTSDAVIAPLFYFAIGGLPLAIAYKAINTLDSMIGYKNEKYLFFGRAAARLDDLANYIPARLTGVVMVISVFAINIVKLLCYRPGGKRAMSKGSADSASSFTSALMTLIRDGRNHSSPNAGIPEAAMAGALGVRLGGPSYYGGTLVEKPYIGRADQPVNASTITRAATITAVSSYIGLVAAVALAFLLLLFGVAAAEAGNPRPLPGNIFTETNNTFNVLLVDKHTSELHVVEVKDNLPRIAKSYGVLHGRNDGDKLKEGDNRTPDGFYYITDFIPPTKLDNTLYGDGAYTLNYPNMMDKIRGKTGHGIWIHGRGPERNNEKTQGCVSLSNSDMANLKPDILSETPVIISDSLELLSLADYAQRKKKYMDMFKAFILSWEKGDFKGFINYFDAGFRSYDGLCAESYLNRKKQLMLSNPKRKIITSNVNIFKDNTTKLMYAFDQLYCTADTLSYGHKRLYLLAKKDTGYKIVAEEFTKREVQPLIEENVISTVNRWKAAWQAKDIEKYISCYSGSFKSGNMDIKQWKAHKKDVFNDAKSIEINLTNLKLKTVSPMRVVVSFRQEYTSGSVKDKGIKTLILGGCPGDYKIVEEAWSGA